MTVRATAPGIDEATRSADPASVRVDEGRSAPRGIDRSATRRLLVVVSILVPLAVFTAWAADLVPSFDGAMNLQVAANLADGDGYVRFYGGRTVFPHEVETSGPFVLLAALVLEVFGMSFFTLQVPNLLFLALLLAGISHALRPWFVPQLLAPSAVLLCVPDVTGLAAGGLGEFPVAAVLLWALILQASVMIGASRPAVRMASSAVLVGVAMTIKVVAVGVLPVVLLGLIVALVVRRDTSRWRLALSALAIALPIGAYELYRLGQLGSTGAYREFWTEQYGNIGRQAGLSTTATVDWLQKGANHMHLLAVQTGIPAESLVVLLVVPGLLLVLSFLLRTTGWREWLAAPGRALALLLTSYAYLYFVWWLFITPTEKAWLRRIIIAIVVLGVVYALLSCIGLDRLLATRAERPAARWVAGGAAAVSAVLVAAVAVISVDVGRRNLDPLLFPDNIQGAVTSATDEAESMVEDGTVLFGGGWWSAPVVSLLSEVPFGDLTELDACSPADAELLASGRAVLVWDRYAMGISGTTPKQAAFEFTRISQPSDYAGFWRLSFVPGACQR